MHFVTPLTTLRLWLNAPAFAMRARLAWRRAGYSENPKSDPQLSNAELQLLKSPYATALVSKLKLTQFHPALSPRAWQINLMYAGLLDQIFTHFHPLLPNINTSFQALDIGSKNFEYAPALHATLCHNFNLAPTLTGVELDAWRIYPDLHSRYDAAQYYLSLLGTEDTHHRYLPNDLCTLPATRPFNFITWFYPFLTPLPLARWGLPNRYLCPTELLSHALSLLAPNGTLLIVNQTAAEARIQRKLLRAASVKFQLKRITLHLAPHAPGRWVFLVMPSHGQNGAVGV